MPVAIEGERDEPPGDESELLLISVHMPKTAGTSFGAALEGHFGEALQRDYADYPLHVEPRLRHRSVWEQGLAAEVADYRSIRCIHGHFLPAKYLLLADQRPCVFVTWLREPIARLVSHYFYWLHSYDPRSPDTRPLHRRMVEEKWSLEQFCLSREMRNVYSQFLWGFPLECFGFIGITEDYENDLRYFSSRYLQRELDPRALNQRDPVAYPRRPDELGAALRSRVEQWHAADIALYRRALSAGKNKK